MPEYIKLIAHGVFYLLKRRPIIDSKHRRINEKIGYHQGNSSFPLFYFVFLLSFFFFLTLLTFSVHHYLSLFLCFFIFLFSFRFLSQFFFLLCFSLFCLSVCLHFLDFFPVCIFSFYIFFLFFAYSLHSRSFVHLFVFLLL